jgi:hypothetical protein
MMGYLGISEPLKSLGTDMPTLVALLVCLIPTTDWRPALFIVPVIRTLLPPLTSRHCAYRGPESPFCAPVM